jgi:hypothetical protein
VMLRKKMENVMHKSRTRVYKATIQEGGGLFTR